MGEAIEGGVLRSAQIIKISRRRIDLEQALREYVFIYRSSEIRRVSQLYQSCSRSLVNSNGINHKHMIAS